MNHSCECHTREIIHDYISDVMHTPSSPAAGPRSLSLKLQWTRAKLRPSWLLSQCPVTEWRGRDMALLHLHLIMN